jgi:hypothetical protein
MSYIRDPRLENIADVNVRRAVEGLRDYIRESNVLAGVFKFLELQFTTNGTVLVPHGLTIQPIDVIQLHVSGTGSIVYNYGAFDRTNISVTISGGPTPSNPLRVRILAGRYEGGV